MQEDLKNNELSALNELSSITKSNEIDWKFQAKMKDGIHAIFVPYINARSLSAKLTAAFGLKWSKNTEYIGFIKDEYVFKTTISVIIDGHAISRDGYAPTTEIEPTKGGESDSFKRAGTAFGFGVDLYNYPTIQVLLKAGTNYPATFNLNVAWDKIWAAYNAKEITSEDIVYVREKGYCCVKEFNNDREIGGSTSKVSGFKPKIQSDKKPTPTSTTPTSFPTLLDIKKHLWIGSGVLSPAAFEPVVRNWMEHGGTLVHRIYIYTVKDGVVHYFMLDDAQVLKLKPIAYYE